LFLSLLKKGAACLARFACLKAMPLTAGRADRSTPMTAFRIIVGGQDPGATGCGMQEKNSI